MNSKQLATIFLFYTLHGVNVLGNCFHNIDMDRNSTTFLRTVFVATGSMDENVQNRTIQVSINVQSAIDSRTNNEHILSVILVTQVQTIRIVFMMWTGQMFVKLT